MEAEPKLLKVPHHNAGRRATFIEGMKCKTSKVSMDLMSVRCLKGIVKFKTLLNLSYTS